MDIIIIKFGGSLITNKQVPFEAKNETLSSIAKQVKLFLNKKIDQKIIITHGSGSFGHTLAKEYETSNGLLPNDDNIIRDHPPLSHEKKLYGAALTQHAASTLNKIFIQKFLDEGIPVMSIAPSAIMQVRKNETVIRTCGLRRMLHTGFIPVLYGDVIQNDHQGFSIASTEAVIDALFQKWQKSDDFRLQKILMACDVPGIKKQGSEEIYENISEKNVKEVQKNITNPQGIDITGGMNHKLEMCLQWAKSGIHVEIFDGSVFGNVEKTLSGEKIHSTKIT